MRFFRTTFWAVLSTGTTMLCGLITTKYVAVIIGPEGMAYTGQFLNSTVVILLLATGACSTGIVKYISEYKDEIIRKKIFSSAIILFITSIIITSLVIISFSGILSERVFNAKSFKDVFIVYSIFMIFPAFNMLASAVFNGLQQIRIMSLLTIVTACLNVISVIFASHYFGLKGVLLANLISSFFAFFLYLYFLKKKGFVINRNTKNLYDSKYVKLLLRFSFMNIISGIIAPSIQMVVRTKLLVNYNSYTAGLWQANTRLSDFYLNFIYAIITMYYLPRLAELQDKSEIKKEIWLGYARILPAVIAITIGIWIFRYTIINVFLTPKFSNMLILLKWQLIGDIIKIASWILGYLMVAKAMQKKFIFTELAFAVIYVLLNFWFINNYGMIGTVYAFTVNCSIYLVTLIILLRKYIF